MRVIIGFAICCLSVGCAQMSVRVDIFDQAYANSTPFLEAAVRADERKAVDLVDGGALDRRESAITSEIQARIKQLVDQRIAPIGSEQPGDKTLFSDMQAVIHVRFASSRDDYLRFLDYAAKAHFAPKAAASSGDSDERKNAQLALQAFADGEQELRRVRVELINKFLDEVSPLVSGTPAAVVQLAAANKELKSAVDQQVASLIGTERNSVLDDPNASLLVNAPPQAWSGIFNRTYGIGTFGNTDIAVKMEGVANFTNKGIRVDATKVTQAAFNGVNLLVKALAAFEGVPMLGGGSGSNANGTTSSAGPNNAQQQLADNQLRIRRTRAAAQDILQAITREAASIDAAGDTDAEKAARASAVQRIKASFTANQGELSPQ